MGKTLWTSDGFFEVEVGSAAYKRLLTEGHELVATRPDSAGGDSDADLPFALWKFPALKAKASELGILDGIEGTGQSGAVNKADLVAALEAHAERSDDADPDEELE